MNFTDVYQDILNNKENHNRGYYNCVPFLGLERLEKIVPGIEMASSSLLGSGSGTGINFYIHTPLMYLEQNPLEDIKYNCILFSLEESKKKIILSEISRYLYTKYNKVISIKELQSIGRYNTLSVEDLKLVKEAEEHINKFLEYVDIQDEIRNPTGIFKYCRDFALQIGTYYNKNNVPLSPEEVNNIKNGIGEDYKKIAYYKTYHPRHFVIIIIDHISLKNWRL